MTTCPNCGNEVRDDFSFCPFCETQLKPYCPSCKRELEAGYVRCPYCGFKLGSETPARKLYVKGGRSRFLNLIIVLSLVGGIIAVVQGASESSFQYANYLYQGPIPDLARYVALAQVPVGILVVLLGILQFFVFYGLAYGNAFSRRHLLQVVGLTFVLFSVMLLLDGMMSVLFPLPSIVLPSDVIFASWALFVLVVVWRYVRIQEVKAILRSTSAS